MYTSLSIVQQLTADSDDAARAGNRSQRVHSDLARVGARVWWRHIVDDVGTARLWRQRIAVFDKGVGAACPVGSRCTG